MEWQQFVMNLETLNPASVEELLIRRGARSVTFTDAGDRPVLEPGPGETPLWHRTRITALFEPGTDMAGLVADLQKSLALQELPEYRLETLAERDWEREWLKDFGPMRFGRRLWVCPTGSRPEQPDAVVVRLDPGLAFGTGSHATTAMCLEWLDSLDLAGKSLLDYGCGSGVLAIAALKLGCERAHAMDIDPQAVLATRLNAAENGVQERLGVSGSADGIEGDFDVVVANILAGPLAELAADIAGHVRHDGQLGLSGILSEQAEEVREAYSPWVDFDEPGIRPQDGQTWARLTGSRRHG
jgi:ribosomal protein L11 methyltransferase